MMKVLEVFILLSNWILCSVFADLFSFTLNRTITSSKELIVTVTAMSVLQCAYYCSKNDQCWAAEYEGTKDMCYLFSVGLPIQSDVHDVKGLFTLDRGHWDSQACPEGWVVDSGRCYFFSTEVAVWSEAVNYCRRHRAILAEPVNRHQIDFLRSNTAARGLTLSHWRVGGMDKQRDGIWTWASSNDVITETDWDDNEPDSSGYCLVLFSGWQYRWGDASCHDDKYNYICEKW